MTQKNKQQMKQIIAEEFGFQKQKIILLETSGFAAGVIEYIRFSVCFIEYAMYYDYIKCTYRLEVVDTLGLVTINE